MTLVLISCAYFFKLFIGQNGAVKDISKNGWNSNHGSQIDVGLAKNTTPNFRGRATKTAASDTPGGKYQSLHYITNLNLSNQKQVEIKHQN